MTLGCHGCPTPVAVYAQGSSTVHRFCGRVGSLSPMRVQIGDQEVLLSDSTRLVERARAAGIEVEVWDQLWHVWHLFAPVLPDASAAFAKVGALVRARLGSR